jgi:hypothetical protein
VLAYEYPHFYDPQRRQHSSAPGLNTGTAGHFAQQRGEQVFGSTQMMESLASLDISAAKGVDVQQLAHAAAILLRDGCDVMDVWRKIQAQG